MACGGGSCKDVQKWSGPGNKAMGCNVSGGPGLWGSNHQNEVSLTMKTMHLDSLGQVTVAVLGLFKGGAAPGDSYRPCLIQGHAG